MTSQGWPRSHLASSSRSSVRDHGRRSLGFAADGLGVENPAQRIVDQFSEQLPQDTTAVLQRQMDAVFSSRSVSLLSLGLVGAVWASASGISALIKALDRAYDVPETRPWWRKTLLSVGLTMTAGVAVVAAFLAVVTVGVWGKDIADNLGAAGIYDWVVRIGRWGPRPVDARGGCPLGRAKHRRNSACGGRGRSAST
jgi:hypothetical protein